MTTQDKIDNGILVAVVESRTNSWMEPLELGDSIYGLEVGVEMDSWIRLDEVLVEQRHVDAADALLAVFPLGYRDPAMTLADAGTWCKTWAGRVGAR